MTVTEATRLELEEGARQNRIRRNRSKLRHWVDEDKVQWVPGYKKLIVAGVELDANFDHEGNPDDETLAKVILAMAANGLETEQTGETEGNRIRRQGNAGVNDLSAWKKGIP